MDNKEKKQLTIFKSVQISKENKEKYFKVERGSLNGNNYKNNNANSSTKNSDISQEGINHIFITHKNKNNSNNYSKKGNNQSNNSIFVTINDKNKGQLTNNNLNIMNEINIIDENVYKTKLNLVYFESIKNLCNHLNKNFNQLIQNENISNINEYLTEMYQNLQLLNRKIDLITYKQTFKINKEDYEILNILLNHLLYMNKILNNTISKNIVNIYSNLNNFFSSCNCAF